MEGLRMGPAGSTERDREELAAFLMRLRSSRIVEPRLLQAVEAVPRRHFVRAGIANPYSDAALPIDCGETMPGAFFAVCLVNDLKVEPTSRILEIGTGSGYVTALLARCGGRVTSLDRYQTLLAKAGERLKQLGLPGVQFVQEDGRDGYRDAAPFDRIVIHAAFETLPRSFLEQLAQHGSIICALGPGQGQQTLVRLQKVGSRLEREDLRPVRYQPLAHGVARKL
ncbi:protein-L-isoaspartate O-methyltransferase [Aureimonas endophytica]|uniref:Protein-L-isoaspartate O-methyltransferase n=1 Tax=Aureimonas endophytica TaxID=2027858 RepID=A0A917DZZ0_9HYPH|nr:protein-L-isoaspartate(D-aspartate) O-methyltransferase [Aureimonas endophytica]GGD87148.1 protein-L-isoaspartate O-methyltransferase [Aureimonas endophytica]